jgi:hypothetical protein
MTTIATVSVAPVATSLSRPPAVGIRPLIVQFDSPILASQIAPRIAASCIPTGPHGEASARSRAGSTG